MRQGVFYSMVPSDEFKPCHISTSRGVTLNNIDWNALIHNPVMQTGSSRYFNWLDWDGTVTQRFRPTVIASWPRWWQLDDDCYYKQEWNSWVCDWYPWRTVARLDIRIPGYTAQVDTQANIPPTQDNYVGYVAQFGRWNADARTMTITRNEGITGVTGTGGWYVHFNNGVTPYFRIFLTQIPVGTSIMFATRYPPGTQFSIRRNFVWYNQYNSQLTQASSLDQVMASTTGELFFFDGRRLYIKLTDPGDASVDPTFSADGASVPGARYFSLSYDVTATNLNNCPFVQGGQFCSMQADPSNDIPPSLPANYNSWAEPYCADVPPPGTSTCAQQVTWGNCNQAWMTQTGNPHLTSIGGYCAVSCGRCQANDRVCVDRPVPGGLSGGNSCSQLAQLGGCYQWWMKAGNFCGNSCGACNGLGVPCIDMPPTDGTTCAQRKSWGSCSQPWMAAGSFCRASCGACTVPGQQQASGACVDLQPSGGYDCKQQQTWGQCSASWLVQGSFCQATCGVCSTSTTNCGDVPPPGGFSCAQQKEWGKCTQAFMRDGGFCKTTCGFCGSACDDNPPPGGYSCAQQKAWGACTQPWMSQGNFCRNTCGTCGTFSAASSSGPAVPMNGTLEGPGASNGSTFSISFPIASNFISSNVVSGTKGPIQMANDRPVLPSLLPNFTLDQPLVTSASPYKPSGSAFVSAQLVAAESGFPGSGALTGLTAAQDVVQLGWAALDGEDPSDPLAQTPLDRYDYPVDSAPMQVFPPLKQAFDVLTVQPAVYPPLLVQQDSPPSPPYPQPSPTPPHPQPSPTPPHPQPSPTPPHPQPSPTPPHPQPSPTPPHPQPSPTPPHPNPPSPHRVSHKPPTLPPPKPRLPVPSREASPPPSAAKLPSRAPTTQPHSKTPAMTALGAGRPPNAQLRQPSPAKPASPSPAVSSQAGRSLLATDAGQVSSAAPPHGYGSWATKPKGGSTVPLPLDSEFVIASAGAPPPGLLLDSPSAPTTKLWSLNVTLRSVQLCSHNCSLTSLEDSMADAIAMVLPPQPSNNSTAEVVELPLCDMCTDSTRGMGGVTCSSFVSWGKCAESWAVENNICNASCMRGLVPTNMRILQPTRPSGARVCASGAMHQ
ncbi:hypothetical protein QJQ45_018693 [Haematococcus lacustris]|nr:hypothetical protein QJQ45_018693 [Haematococcus lacustris]